MTPTAAAAPPTNRFANVPLLRYVPGLAERSQGLFTVLNLHFAGLAVLLLLVLYLALHLVLGWQQLDSMNAAAMDRQQVNLRAAELAARPLKGLDGKLITSRADADQFYARRLPDATSEVATEVGALAQKAGVHLTRAQYAYSPVLSGGDALTEVRIDASVSGDYRPIVLFINALERDKTFFLINSINLTGQQTGNVNLRLRVTTYLRSPLAGTPSDVPTTGPGSGGEVTTGTAGNSASGRPSSPGKNTSAGGAR